MVGFGSRNFGQANYGFGLRFSSVDEVATQSTMDAAGYLIFDKCTVHNKATTNVDAVSGLLQGGFLLIPATGTAIMSGIKMQWYPNVAVSTATSSVDSSGKLAWDSQIVGDSTWTTQIVGD